MIALVLSLAVTLVPPGTAGAQDPSQSGSNPETILSRSDPILGNRQGWTVGGGFVFWYERCGPGQDTEATLNRRAVDGFAVTNLATIDDAGACETFVGPAVDESGFHYYNRSGGTIEVISHDSVGGQPEVLADIGQRASDGLGYTLSDLVLDDEHVYWIEYDPGGEFTADAVRVRRVAKDGGEPDTLLDYEASWAGRGAGLAVTDDWILWTDSDGLQGMRKSSCPEDCSRTLIHAAGGMQQGGVEVNADDDIVWWNHSGPFDLEIFHTTCSATGSCDTQHRYTAEAPSTINDLVASDDHFYWIDRRSNATPPHRLLRLPISGGAPDTLVEGDVEPERLALDERGVYYPADLTTIARLPLDAAAIEREIGFRAWEVTQAVQDAEAGEVPLVAGQATSVRVYPELDGADSAGVEAVLHGERDGQPLPGSPLRPANGAIPVAAGATLEDQRGDPDGGWVFELPSSWTTEGDEAVPQADTTIDLRAELDPRGLSGGAAPAATAEDTFAFAAKAPTCMDLRPVWTEARHQSAWDQSVAGVFEVSESIQPTPDYVPFTGADRLEKTEWCRKGIAYGPFCSRPYDLDEHRASLMRKLWRKSFLGSAPTFCREHGARTHRAGIVSAEADWEYNGYALLGSLGMNVLLSKVPRYGTWDWPMSRTEHTATTLAHEVAHNFGRNHIDCGGPDGIDTDYPYDPCTLDDGDRSDPATHFGFDTRLREPVDPHHSVDHLTYSGPPWVSDYTWRAIFERTRRPEPVVPFASTLDVDDDPDAYLLLSGEVAPDEGGELHATVRYPSAEASDELLATWREELAEPHAGQPYHLRLLDGDGGVLADRAVDLPDDFVDVAALPFNAVLAEPDARVARIELLEGGSVLDTASPGAHAPEVAILAPEGGEVVDDEVTLEWQASDPDDAAFLEYAVQYSPDDGESWHALAVDEPGVGRGEVERRSLDLGGQPSSEEDRARLRVLASDGYHTGLATSEPFTVAARGPEATITSPGEDEQLDAGEAVSLRGRALHADEGVLGDGAFTWTVAGRELDGRRGLARGLAPGAHTATLTATDSAGRQDTAATDFEVAPLQVSRAAEPTLDGRCDDSTYGERRLDLSPYEDGEVAHGSVLRTAEHLWVCVQGLEGAGDDEYAGFQIDLTNSQASTVQDTDRGFFVRADGASMGLVGDGDGFASGAADGLATRVTADGSTWSAELRLDADVVGGWQRRVALALGHHGGEDGAAWPHTATLEDPRTWAQTILGGDEPVAIAEVAPDEATVGEAVDLTVTGTGFASDSAILWEGQPLATTQVDDATLQATVAAGSVGSPGFADVQVAPGGDPALASPPSRVLVANPRPEIHELTPDSALDGGDDFTLSVQGAGFTEGATVLWNWDERPTTVFDGGRLEASIPAADLEAVRSVAVTVANPEPSVGLSEPVRFSVAGPDRIAGRNRFETAALLSQATFDPGVEAAYVATGFDFADALTGGVAAGLDRAPVLLTAGDDVPQATADELERLAPRRIVILGGEAAVGAGAESELAGLTDGPVHRLAGPERFSTAARVSQATFDDADTVFVGTGLDFPDGLAGVPAGVQTPGPLLLATRDGLPEPTAAELARLDPDRVIVLGGTAVISEAVEAELDQLASVQRVAGSQRFATAAMVADLLDAPEHAYIATGLDFADALTAGAVAGATNAPVLLAAPDLLPGDTQAALHELDPETITIMGGDAAIGPDVADQLDGLLAD